MKTIKYIIICALLFFLLAKINAQVPHFHSYNVIPDIKSYQVNVVFQDKSGFIWLGTDEGLVQFDGAEIMRYTDKNGLVDNVITAIGQDSAGVLWIGHKSGAISLLNHGKAVAFNPEEGVPVEKITAIFIDSEKTVWFSTHGEGLYYYKNNRLYNFSVSDGLADDYVYSIVELDDSIIACGTDGGISFYDKKAKSFETFSMKNGLPDNIVKKLIVGENKRLFVGMEDFGIVCYQFDKKQINTITNFEVEQLKDFAYAGNNEFWIASGNRGMYRVTHVDNAFKTKMFTENHGLVSNSINSVFVDFQHNVWMGGKRGATVCAGNKIEQLDKLDGLDLGIIFDITELLNGSLVVCSEKGLFNLQTDLMGNNSLVNMLPGKSLSKSSFVTAFLDSLNYLWVGSLNEGVLRFSPDLKSNKQFSTKTGFPTNNILSVGGNKTDVWFATLGSGAIKLNLATLETETFNTENGLKSNYVYSVFTDSSGNVWFACDGGGISVLQNNQFVPLPDAENFPNTVYSITEFNPKMFLFSTSDGLFSYDFNKAKKISGIKTSEIASIESLDANHILAIHNFGFNIIELTKNNEVQVLQEYDVEDLKPQLNAIYKTRSGHVLIGTDKAIIKYNYKIKATINAQPKVVLSTIRLLFSPTNLKTFSHNQNHLTFDFIGFWYKEPEQIFYRYMLEGHDKEWSIKSKNRSVTYSQLQPGKFTFKVEISVDGVNWFADENSSTSFEILAPLWQRLWFQLLAVIAVVFLVFMFVRIRLKNLQDAKEALELEVTKRTLEIVKQKEEIEAQRDQIREANKSLTDSILYARRIQSAVLPPQEIIAESLPEHFILFKPRDIVSGDYYYFNRKDDKVIIAAADCTGHGVPGAFMSLLGISFMNEIINKFDHLCAGELLTVLRGYVKRSLRQTGKVEEAKDGMDIALCIIDLTTLSAEFAGANNPLWYVRNGEMIEIEPDKMPIGIHYKESSNFTNHDIQLQKGDMLYLFSDGYTDQFGGMSNKKYLKKNLKKLFLEHYMKPVEKQLELYELEFEQWKNGGKQIDDVLIIGIRV